MHKRRFQYSVPVACSLWLGFGLAAETQVPASASEDAVVQRFLSRRDEPVTRYRAYRRLEGRNERFNLYGWMEAWTDLSPDGFRYAVTREGGSEYIRNKVLRPVLQTEERIFATADASKSTFTSDNYDIAGSEPAEPGLVKLFAKPKRREVSLIDGAVFVTWDDADLVRVEGRLAKNPSFWTKRVDVVRRYGRVAGVRVPMRLDSTAQIRLAGSSTLTMTYEYEMVNGQHVAAANITARRP